jgi:hypothetical protein
VNSLKEVLGIKNDADGKQVISNDISGPIEGSGAGQWLGQLFGTENQQTRDQAQALLSALELDVAKMKLKGSVTEQSRSNKLSQKNSGANNSPTKSKRSDRSNNRYENES